MTNDHRCSSRTRSQEIGGATRMRQNLKFAELGANPERERKRYMMRLYMRRSLFGYGNI
jgi:hypothetical protein